MNILIHVSDKRGLEWLDPEMGEDGYVYFFSNAFMSYFGQFLYLFGYKELSKHFEIERGASSFVSAGMGVRQDYGGARHITFNSDRIPFEYKIRSPIDVARFCLGVIENFNYLKGEVEERLTNYVGDILSGRSVSRKRLDLSVGEGGGEDV